MTKQHTPASVCSPAVEALGTTLRLGSLASDEAVAASFSELHRDLGALVPARTGHTLDGVGPFECVQRANTSPEYRRPIAREPGIARRNPPPLPVNNQPTITIDNVWELEDERASGIFETHTARQGSSEPEPETIDLRQTLAPSVEPDTRRLTSRLLLSPTTWAVLSAMTCAVVYMTTLDTIWTFHATSRGRGVLLGPGAHAVFAAISGEVEQVYVRQGDQVQAGDVMLTLDSASLRDQQVQSKRRLELAERRLAELDSTLEPHERGLEQLRAQMKLVQRQSQVPGDAHEPGQQKNSQLELELARTQMQAVMLERELHDERERAQTKLEDARVADAELAHALEHLKVRAPATGRIRGLEVVAGSAVRSGQTLATLATVSAPTEAVAFVSASDRKHLQLGASVRIELDRFPSELGMLTGTVREIGAQLASREELQSLLTTRASEASEPAYRVDIALSLTAKNQRLLERLNSGTMMHALFDLGQQAPATLDRSF